MRAVVYDRYGPPEVQRLEEVERPVPKDDEVLIRIHATTVNRADCATREANRRNGPAVMLLSRSLTGLRRPSNESSVASWPARSQAIGAAVRDFAVGEHGLRRQWLSVRRACRIHLHARERPARI